MLLLLLLQRGRADALREDAANELHVRVVLAHHRVKLHRRGASVRVRTRARRDLVESHGEGVGVRARVQRFAHEDLWCEVGERADHLSKHCAARRAAVLRLRAPLLHAVDGRERLGALKVCKLRPQIASHDDVCRLDVAVRVARNVVQVRDAARHVARPSEPQRVVAAAKRCAQRGALRTEAVVEPAEARRRGRFVVVVQNRGERAVWCPLEHQRAGLRHGAVRHAAADERRVAARPRQLDLTFPPLQHVGTADPSELHGDDASRAQEPRGDH